MIEHKAHVIGVVYSVNDCINAGVGHKIDPVVDGGLWVQLKTKASTRTTKKPYLAIVGWKDLETTFIRDISTVNPLYLAFLYI